VVYHRAAGADAAAGAGGGAGSLKRPSAAARIRQVIEARHCHLLFLPPYSPDCTPIEQAFSKIKAILRALGARTTEALWEAMRVAVQAITPNDAIAWFAHAGYALSAPAT
jgi:transposase